VIKDFLRPLKGVCIQLIVGEASGKDTTIVQVSSNTFLELGAEDKDFVQVTKGDPSVSPLSSPSSSFSGPRPTISIDMDLSSPPLTAICMIVGLHSQDDKEIKLSKPLQNFLGVKNGDCVNLNLTQLTMGQEVVLCTDDIEEV
jgi:hypothetical protein